MLAHAVDYLPEALEAARTELGRRNLPAERQTQLQAITETKVAGEKRLADEPLGWPMRILILIGVCPVIWLALWYEHKGQRRKARESWIWLGYAIVFWIAVRFIPELVTDILRR